MPISGISQEELKEYLKDQMGLDGDIPLQELSQRWFNSGAWIRPSDEPGLMSRAINRTATVQTLTTAAAATGLIITVQPTRRKVEIKWSAQFDVTVAGQGTVQCALYEITNGAAVLKEIDRRHAGTGLVTTSFTTIKGFKGVGASQVSRVFALYVVLTREAASSFTARLLNSNTESGQTYLEAVAL